MSALTLYEPRPVRFLGIEKCDAWRIKLYSISYKNEFVPDHAIAKAREHIALWFQKASLTHLPHYKVATLIIHEGREGLFAIISWWADENMLQLFCFFATSEKPDQFLLISDRGIVSCVWEMAVLWFERNAWVNCVLKKPDDPEAIEQYLGCNLDADI